jgi:DNA gyrase subunit A
MSDEDLIPDEDVVVTITVRRLRQAHPFRPVPLAEARRQGRARARQLRGDDEVQHLFTTTSHHWLLFFTNFGPRLPREGVQLPEAGRDAKGSTWPTC